MCNEEQIRMEWKKQLAIDFNCTVEDLDSKENVITVAKNNQGQRMYTQQKAFFSMVTLGKNTVLSADEEIHEWLRQWIAEKNGIWLFEHSYLMELEMELQKYRKKLGQSHHMFLPKVEIKEPTIDFELRWFEQKEIMQLYGQETFSNALCEKFLPQRPDILAVGAMQEEKIIGLAGCSADTALFWQIGIDVLPAYRGMGIGTKLVQLLKNEVFRRGVIPFYGTSLSNIHSWNIALNCGFYPAWVEIETVEE
jgi:Acetyltransferases